MAYTLNIDAEAQTVYLVWRDVVSVAELMLYEEIFWRGESHMGYHHSVDFRESLMDIEFGELFALAAQATSGVNARYHGARTALVVGDDLQEELAEFYCEARHQVCSREIREVRVFRDPEAANAWLGEAAVVR